MAQQEQHQPVDLNKLSQRELLILTYKEVEQLKIITGEQASKQSATDIEMAVIKTKMQLWSAVIGFITGLAASLLLLALEKLFK
jgi:hypothetical protein